MDRDDAVEALRSWFDVINGPLQRTCPGLWRLFPVFLALAASLAEHADFCYDHVLARLISGCGRLIARDDTRRILCTRNSPGRVVVVTETWPATGSGVVVELTTEEGPDPSPLTYIQSAVRFSRHQSRKCRGNLRIKRKVDCLRRNVCVTP